MLGGVNSSASGGVKLTAFQIAWDIVVTRSSISTCEVRFYL